MRETTETLDVGCGSARLAKGTVNIDLCRGGENRQVGNQTTGETLNPKGISNFIVADASYLPFRDKVFDSVFSSHVIEHCRKPSLMFKEANRVSKGKVTIRCPHRRGTGARRPFHLHYLDEQYFKQASDLLGIKSEQFITTLDHPLTNRLPFISEAVWSETLLGKKVAKSLPWRAVRRLERKLLTQKAKIPFEVESWSFPTGNVRDFDPVTFFVVFNNIKTLQTCFLSSDYLDVKDMVLEPNFNRKSLPFLMQIMAMTDLARSKYRSWYVFCHQDFILQEDLRAKLRGLDANAVYGVTGTRMGSRLPFGQIVQTDGSLLGLPLSKPEPVQTVDEMCLIVHSSLFEKGLVCFDSDFRFHFYGADLCMTAHTSGLGVYALQVKCQHKSRNLIGDNSSQDFQDGAELFRKKWMRYLPVKTTSKEVYPEGKN